jgi:predicted metalloprotease with PDZ domain
MSLLAGGLAVVATLAATGADTVRYQFTAARDDSLRPVIDVRVQFRGNAIGRTIIELPHAWAGQNDLERSVTRLAVARPSSARLVDADSAHRRYVRHAPGEQVELRYRLRQDWTGPARRPQYFRALVGDDVVVLMGQNSLVHPARRDMDSLVVEFAWRGTPADWVVTSSFGEGKTQRALTTMNEFLEGVIVAGRFRPYTVSAYGRPIRIIVRGTWTFPDTALVRTARELATRQRAFWHDGSARNYLVAALPAVGGTGGTAFTHALVMYSDSTTPLAGFAGLLSHEMFHEWNGHAIRTAGPEGGMKWFSEGFTEFFADRFSRDAGFLSQEQYLARVNNSIRQYYLSPVRNATRDDINRSYWSNPDMNRLPYTQGYVIAAFLDGELQNASNHHFTIDSVLFAVFRRARASRQFVDDAMFVGGVPAAVRGAVRDSMQSFVVAGHTVPVTARAFGDCVDVRTEEMFPFDLGFDAAASTRDRITSGVRAGSAADSAGLRDGMLLRGWSWFNGDASRPASVRVAEGDSVRRIVWMPRGEHSVSVPQLVRSCHPERSEGSS